MKYRMINYVLGGAAIAAIGLGQLACSSSAPQTSTTASPGPAATQTPVPIAQAASPVATATVTSPVPSATVAGASSGTAPAADVEKPKPPRTYTLSSGRVLSVYTSSSLSTKTSKTGEPFVGSLSKAIVDGDWVIAKKGAHVDGVVTNSDPGGRVKGVASITVALKHLTLADGRKLAISTSPYSKLAPTTKKKDAKKIGIGAGAGALIGGIAGGGKGAAIGAGVGGGAGTAATLATRGDPAVIPSEALLTFKMNAPVKITK